MKYAIKYKDPRWQRKRLEVMQRDGFACICCGEGEEMLNVHHSYYVAGRDPWEYPDSSLITLCQSCHRGFSEDPEKFDSETECHGGLGWWEPELSAVMSMMNQPSFVERPLFYSTLANCEAVKTGEVDPEFACLVICRAMEHLLSSDWIQHLDGERAQAERRTSAKGGGL